MNDTEIVIMLNDIARQCNDAIDKLIIVRQNCLDNRKQKLRYITKKLEVIVGAANRGLEKLE